ncbi:MAG: glycosyltransferase [Candidatus Omnitrophica bacterium]|nr:glycosyltransferase [Candidatus Omnitrophota bacterium]
MGQRISAVIPTFNERESVVSIIQTLKQQISSLEEIIVVDDDSPDKTWEVVENLRAKDSTIRLIRRLHTRGLASALWEGIASSRGESVLWLDADFKAPEGTLERLTTALRDCDIAVASRYVPGGRDSRTSWIRRAASAAFNVFARQMLRVPIKDLTSGYALARKHVLKQQYFQGIHGSYFVRLMYQSHRQGARISEVPYACLSRTQGYSKTTEDVFTFFKLGFLYIMLVINLIREKK